MEPVRDTSANISVRRREKRRGKRRGKQRSQRKSRVDNYRLIFGTWTRPQEAQHADPSTNTRSNDENTSPNSGATDHAVSPVVHNKHTTDIGEKSSSGENPIATKSNFCETMNESKIRLILEYEFRRGTNASQTAGNINKIFGEGVANERTVHQWFEKFRSGDFNLENEPHWRPVTKVDNDELKTVVEADTSLTTRELAARFDVTIPTILDHLKQIGKVNKLGRWVPHKLNEHQKRNRLEACLSLLSRRKGGPFLHRIVMCDEK